jgi:hypothetical protein
MEEEIYRGNFCGLIKLEVKRKIGEKNQMKNKFYAKF